MVKLDEQAVDYTNEDFQMVQPQTASLWPQIIRSHTYIQKPLCDQTHNPVVHMLTG